MVDLVALPQSAQDADRVFHGRLVDLHGLEPPFERRILLDVLAVLIQRGRADRVQLAARQHRLQQVGRVDRSFRGARADHGVELVDEQDDAALAVCDFLEHGLQALLELAAVLRTGDQRAHVQRDDLLVAQALRHVAADDALRQPLDDGGLADAGLADQHRIVLGAARQHLNHAADLVVAADDGIELALARDFREVAAVPFERLELALRILIGHALRAAHAGQCRQDGVVRDAVLLQQLRRGRPAARRRQRQQQVLGAGELVLEPPGFVLGRLKDRAQPRVEPGAAPPCTDGSLSSSACDAARSAGKSTCIFERTAVAMPSGCVISVCSRCSGMTSGWPDAFGKLLRRKNGLLCFFRIPIQVHDLAFPVPASASVFSAS